MSISKASCELQAGTHVLRREERAGASAFCCSEIYILFKLVIPFVVTTISLRAKELNRSVVGREVLLHYNKRLFIIQIGGDDAIKIFGINRSGVFGRGIQRN